MYQVPPDNLGNEGINILAYLKPWWDISLTWSVLQRSPLLAQPWLHTSSDFSVLMSVDKVLLWVKFSVSKINDDNPSFPGWVIRKFRSAKNTLEIPIVKTIYMLSSLWNSPHIFMLLLSSKHQVRRSLKSFVLIKCEV